nr:Unknown Function [uncultured bacterium]
MTRGEIYNAISEFLDLIRYGRESVQANEEQLVIALDRLAFVYQFSEAAFDERNYPDSPDRNYSELRAVVVERFPNYGYYNLPCEVTIKIAETEEMVGDAIDDITDIALDMQEIEWKWKNTSETDAIWHFRYGASRHWIDHMRHLQFYLNARYYEA